MDDHDDDYFRVIARNLQDEAEGLARWQADPNVAQAIVHLRIARFFMQEAGDHAGHFDTPEVPNGDE